MRSAQREIYLPQQARSEALHSGRKQEPKIADPKDALSAPDSIFLIQRSAGNQAVQDLLHRGLIHAKLNVSDPADPEEREADRIAEHVMAAPQDSKASAPCTCDEQGTTCEACNQKNMTVQRQADSTASSGGSPSLTAPASSIPSLLRGESGQPLDAATRSFFESRFGRDFSDVRVHAGASAAESARSIDAQAYAAGSHLVFNQNQYAPASAAGQRLLAHELAHVVQQGSARRLGPSGPASPARGPVSRAIQRKPDAQKPKSDAQLKAEYVTNQVLAGRFREGEQPLPAGESGPPSPGGAFWLLNGLSDSDMAAVLHLCDMNIRKQLLAHIAEADGLYGRARLEAAIVESTQDVYDRIAKRIFNRVDYDDFVAKDLKSTTFFGQTISGVQDELADTLKKVEDDLGPGYKSQAPKASSALRKRKAMHAFGMAIDFDVARNPYVLNESGEKQLDPELLKAYDHIADFMLGKSQSDIHKLSGGRAAFSADGKTPAPVGDIYDSLKAESDAMQRYFALKNDAAKLAEFLTNEWPLKHVGQTTPAIAAVQAQMQDDYEALGGANASGQKRATGGKGDRPFAPSSGGGAGDPATGFLNMPKDFVVAMTKAGFAWGAVDFPKVSGDIQHFDLRLIGTGKRVIDILYQ